MAAVAEREIQRRSSAAAGVHALCRLTGWLDDGLFAGLSPRGGRGLPWHESAGGAG
jgi:hypothetical protein